MPGTWGAGKLGVALLLLSVPHADFAQATRPAALRAAHRGGPWLNLRDGSPIATVYHGDSARVQILQRGQARSLSLASADFDEDGVPDLVSGYSAPDGGIVAVHRGNIEALWPYGKALRNGDPPPFLPDVPVFSLPEAPDFLGAGDFNADGHWDIVAAQRGSRALWFLFGDGHGGFSEPQKVDLSAGVTALATGEVNRRDGLTDIAVGVADDAAAAAALVFESPMGASRADPEVFPLPAPAASFAIGALERGGRQDLVIAAGRDLIVVHGRDRRLSVEKSEQAKVPAARISRQTLDFEIASIALSGISNDGVELAALGRDEKVHILRTPRTTAALRGPSQPPAEPQWTESGQVAVPGGRAMVAGRVSTAGAGDLLVLASDRVHVVSPAPHRSGRRGMELAASLEVDGGAPAAVLPMRLNQHPLSGLVMLHANQAEPLAAAAVPVNVFTVTNTSDSGAGSLRQAITDANSATGLSTINFAIPNTDPNRDPATGVFRISPIVQNANQLGPYIQALPDLSDAVVTLDGYTQPGASPNTLANGDNATILIEINGVQEAQKGALPGGSGLGTFGYTFATIRGFAINEWTSRATGGFLSSANPCYGPTGVVSDGECSDSNAGSGADGIYVGSCGGVIEGNFIGTDATGTAVKSNLVGIVENGGVCSFPDSGVTIGGTTPEARNIISGNIFTQIGTGGGALPTIQGNFIGTDKSGATGMFTVGSRGVTCNCEGMLLGGTTAGAGNVISGNGFLNVHINGLNCNIVDQQSGAQLCDGLTPSNDLVQGNIIGADVTGTHAVLPHNGSGIYLEESVSNTTIGGTTPAARNIIAGNQSTAMVISNGSFSNMVQGNFIGADITGTKVLGVGEINLGITQLDANASPPFNITIGGAVSGAGNVLAGGLNGIEIFGDAPDPNNSNQPGTNIIQGNFIGTDATGTLNLGNTGNGIWLESSTTAAIGASHNIIGGTAPGARNIIAFNGFDGVSIDPGAANAGGTPGNNQVTGNLIFSNSLAGVRVASGIQNLVSRNSVFQNGGFGIDFNLGSANDNFGGNCQANTGAPNNRQNAPVLSASNGTRTVSATATDAGGNTSMFSNCAAYSGTSFNIAGSLNSTANTAFTLEFYENDSCDASGFGQGKTFLGSQTVTTGANCIASFNQAIDLTKADLSVAWKQQNTTFVGSAPTGLFQAVVTNNGSATAHNVVATDTLPAELNLLTVTTTEGSCSNVQNAITCNLGALPSGATATITITFGANTAGSLSNTISVTATEPDPVASNNSATAAISVSNSLPLFTHVDPPSVVAGGPDLKLNIYGNAYVPGLTTITIGGTPAAVTNVASLTSDGQNFSYTGCAFGVKSCQQITVTVPAALMASPGQPTIVMSNPAPGGGSSSSLSLAPAKRFTVLAACSYTVSPNSPVAIANGTPPGGLTHFTGAGVPLTFSVAPTPTNCTWNNVPNVPWLVARNPGDFEGNATSSIFYTALPNPGPPRTGTITLAGQQIVINQAGGAACFIQLESYTANYPLAGGSGKSSIFEVAAQCLEWTAVPDSPWITITAGGSTGTVNTTGNSSDQTTSYVVAANSGAPRTGHINFKGSDGGILAALTITQAGSSKCDVNSDGRTDLADIQAEINQALGKASFAADLNLDGVIDVVDVQIVLNADLALGCAADPQTARHSN